MTQRKKRAAYASRRVDLAVNRMLAASSLAEKMRATQWAAAWGRVATKGIHDFGQKTGRFIK